MDSQFVPTPLQPLQERDLLKQQLAKEKDLTLISVPFWWDGKEERYRVTLPLNWCWGVL